MEPFKNAISPALVRLLAGNLNRVHPAFERDAFTEAILSDLETRELKSRVDLIAENLLHHLPEDTAARSAILEAVLHPEESHSPEQVSDETGMRGFIIWPLSLVAGKHGLDNLPVSLDLLKQMTKRFSSEFGIRFPLIHDQDAVLRHIAPWVEDPSPHVRRLVSEGTRPRLPWGQQLPSLIADPAPMLPLLERLRDDPAEYVRRSVANHLNDISKDHTALVTDLAEDWMKGADTNRKRLLRHACRSLIKAGNPAALAVFGHAAPKLRLEGFALSPAAITLGESVTVHATLVSTASKPQSLVVDLVAKFRKANGSLAEKVFKGANLGLEPKGSVEINRKLSIKPITTRRYYSGTQRLSLRINGQDFGDESFKLTVP